MLENGRGFNEKWAWHKNFAHIILTEPPFKKSCIRHWLGTGINTEERAPWDSLPFTLNDKWNIVSQVAEVLY